VKVLLVDFFVDGHHVEYAAHFGRHFVEQGHIATFVTWHPDDRLKPLSDIGVGLRYVAGGESLAADTLHMMPQFNNALRQCFKIAKSESAAIIHILQMDRAIMLPLWWNLKLFDLGLPIFGTLHAPYHFVNHACLSPSQKLYHRLVRRTLKSLLMTGKLATLFVHTQHIKEIVVNALRRACMDDRVGVVPNPLTDFIYPPGQDSSKEACRTLLGLPTDRVVILFFGQLREEKGPDILLEAAKSLPANTLVLLAGAPSGSFRLRKWEEEVRSRGLGEQVRLNLGHVPAELVSVYFQAADAVVLPYRKSFLAVSGVLQWAAGAHKPVIATDVGENGDLVRTYGLGLVIEPEDPRRLAEAIRQYVLERETIENSVKQCASVYSSLNHWRRAASSVLAAYERAVPHFRLQ
jgi:glycosyltransferase involved in cell wall biosynthesis